MVKTRISFADVALEKQEINCIYNSYTNLNKKTFLEKKDYLFFPIERSVADPHHVDAAPVRKNYAIPTSIKQT
jgi:hypothetical protein